MIEYKGYLAEVEFDAEAEILHGEVINTRDVITFQAADASELKRQFHRSVDEYLKFCADLGEDPEKPFSGKFVVRLSPETHRKLYLAAKQAGMSLNAYIARHLEAGAKTANAKTVDAR